jgi:hypothetical protein
MTTSAGFLSRWSRLKREGGPATAAAGAEAATPAPLPALDTLNFDADFSGFLRQEVEEAVKRVALKKLFHSGPFNVMDGLDTYIDDYSIEDPIDAATVRGLAQARGLLFDELAEEDGAATTATAATAAAPEPAALSPAAAPETVGADTTPTTAPNPGDTHVAA